VRYGPEHVGLGLPAHYCGVPLFPVQAVEATWALAVVVTGTTAVIRGVQPGEGLVIYVVGYALGRWVIELVRGDDVRPEHAGFTSAQWTSVVLTAGASVL